MEMASSRSDVTAQGYTQEDNTVVGMGATVEGWRMFVFPAIASRKLTKAKARFVEETPNDPSWRLLHRLADAAFLPLRLAMRRVFESFRDAVPRTLLAEHVISGLQEGTVRMVENVWQATGLPALAEALRSAIQALALQAAQATALPAVTKQDIVVVFDVADPEALAAIEQYAGTRIVAIDATTREAIRDIITQAFTSGQSLTGQIADIAQLVGLTPTQAAAMARFREGLQASGISGKRIQELIAQRAKAWHLQRAETIARTETINSVMLGQEERWKQAARDGLLDVTRLRRFWVVTPDDRLCPVCATIPGMNLQGVALEEPFQTSRGPIQRPTAHPSCRCALNSRII